MKADIQSLYHSLIENTEKKSHQTEQRSYMAGWENPSYKTGYMVNRPGHCVRIIWFLRVWKLKI